MTGECITHNRVFEKGREKHFGYQNFGNDGSGLQGHEVNNDPDAPILQRLLKNETLTGWEFFVGLLLILLAVVGASGVGGAVGVQTQRFGIVQFEFVVVASCLHAAVAVQLVVRLVFVVVGQ